MQKDQKWNEPSPLFFRTIFETENHSSVQQIKSIEMSEGIQHSTSVSIQVGLTNEIKEAFLAGTELSVNWSVSSLFFLCWHKNNDEIVLKVFNLAKICYNKKGSKRGQNLHSLEKWFHVANCHKISEKRASIHHFTAMQKRDWALI